MICACIYPLTIMTDITIPEIHEFKMHAPPPQAAETKESKEWVESDNGKRSMNWVFTWNNYTVEDLKTVNEDWLKLPDMRCIMFEPEIAPTTRTPHLQGFFVFKSLKSFKQVKSMISPKIRFAQMRKPIEANIKYCSKDGNAIVLGELPKTQAERGAMGKEYVSQYGHVWDHFIRDVKAGISFKDLAEKYPDMHGQFPRGFREKFDLFSPKPTFNLKEKYAELYSWQIKLLELVDQPADERAVFWIYSKMGAVGKSDMLKHLVSVCDFEPMQNAPTRDLACAWKGGHVVFDYSRSQQDSGLINYDVIEHIKNRLLFSPKYESVTKMSENFKNVFVICFSNQPPDVTKLSKDRWHIFEIEDLPNRQWRRCSVVGDVCV